MTAQEQTDSISELLFICSLPDTAHDSPLTGRHWKNPLSINML